MKEMFIDVPARLVKSYKHCMVGGQGGLPCYVISERSTEPLVPLNQPSMAEEVVRK